MVKTYTLLELLDEEPEDEKRITVTKKSFTIDGYYSINFDQCRTHEGLLDWVRHLLCKDKITKYIIGRFIDEVLEVYPELKLY